MVVQVDAAAGDLVGAAAHRERALGREVERREPRRRLRGDDGRASGRRAARWPGSGSRARAIRRRWIAIARSNSISCSVIAHSSVSHGCRRAGARAAAEWRAPRARSPGRRGSGRGTAAGRRRRRWRSASARSPAWAAASDGAARGEDDAVARWLHHADEHRLAVDVQQPLRARRRGGAAARPSSRRRAGTARAAEPRRGPRPRVSRAAAGGRRPGTSSTTRSRRSRRLALALARETRVRRRVHDGDRGGAGHEAGRRQRGRLDARAPAAARLDRAGLVRRPAGRRRPRLRLLRPRLTNPTA